MISPTTPGGRASRSASVGSGAVDFVVMRYCLVRDALGIGEAYSCVATWPSTR